jgi:hypothetical protein
MAQNKLPAFQFYPGDWRKDPAVQSLDYETRGVWIELLCLMHESEQRGKLMLAGRAMTDVEISRLLGISVERAKQNLSKLEANGVANREQETGALVCRRMVRDEDLRQARSTAGRKGGKQKPKQTRSKTQAKRGSSVSSSSSSTQKYVDKSTSEADADGQAIHQRIGPVARRAAGAEPTGGDTTKRKEHRSRTGDWIRWAERAVGAGVSVDELEARIGGLVELRDRGAFGDWIPKHAPMTPAVFERQPALRPQAEAAWARYGPDESKPITEGLVAL